jgi:hypothetical protein
METDAYDTFGEAAERAKFLACTFAVGVQVQTFDGGWTVPLPSNYDAARDTMGRPPVPPPDDAAGHMPDDDWDAEVDEDDGERALLHEELTEDGENWARSEEDGWFYPD